MAMLGAFSFHGANHRRQRPVPTEHIATLARREIAALHESLAIPDPVVGGDAIADTASSEAASQRSVIAVKIFGQVGDKGAWYGALSRTTQ
jgi:hypothetical protein